MLWKGAPSSVKSGILPETLWVGVGLSRDGPPLSCNPGPSMAGELGYCSSES